MILILLPNTNIFLPQHIESKVKYNNTILPLSQSINYYLNKVIVKVIDYDYSFFTNIYMNISIYKPLSQSYYIFIEMIDHFDISRNIQNISYFPKDDVIDWGIIESFNRLNNKNIYNIYSTNIELPNEIIEKNINVSINKEFVYKGVNTSNIIIIDDITILDEFITNKINIQKNGSTMILKIDNCFDEYTVKILYYLCAIYSKVFITKPLSSWGGSSTKYVVCKYYKGNIVNNNVLSIHDLKLTNFFLSKIAEVNCIYAEIQIDILLNIFNKPEKINTIMKSYQQRTINWFIKHKMSVGVEYNVNGGVNGVASGGAVNGVL